MWNYEKRLEFPVNIKRTDPKMAQLIITQYGGPDGELGAFKAHHNYKILDIKKAHTRYVLFLYLRWLSYRPYTGIPI